MPTVDLSRIDLRRVDDLYEALRARIRGEREEGNVDLDSSNLGGVMAIMATLAAVYPPPRGKFTAATCEAYAAALDDLPLDELAEAARVWALENEFPPAVSDLRKLVIERRLSLPDTVHAWELLLRALADEDDPGMAILGLPVEVQRALKMVGGAYAVKTARRPELLRRDFSEAYEMLRTETIRQANFTSAGLPPPTPRFQLEGGDSE